MNSCQHVVLQSHRKKDPNKISELENVNIFLFVNLNIMLWVLKKNRLNVIRVYVLFEK